MTLAPVAVTGMGLECSLGSELAQVWKRLADGDSGISPISLFDPEQVSCKIAGEVHFDPSPFLTPKDTRRSIRVQQLAVAAAVRAGAEQLPYPRDRVAMIVGCGGAGIAEMSNWLADVPEKGWRALDRLILTKALPHAVGAFVAARLGITGPVFNVATACSSSTDAIALAQMLLQADNLDAVLVIGADAPITELGIVSFAKLEALTSRPPEEASIASRPFDANRDGMVPAEGAAALVLERRPAPGRPVYAEILSGCSTCDAGHAVAPREDGAVALRAVAGALEAASLRPDDVAMVSAHGTSTKLNDVVETRIIKEALGAHASSVPITAPKSVLGHSLGASGAIETATTIMALIHQVVPPTVNLDDADPACDLDYTPNVARPFSGDIALKLSFGFGGHNAVVAVRRGDVDASDFLGLST